MAPVILEAEWIIEQSGAACVDHHPVPPAMFGPIEGGVCGPDDLSPCGAVLRKCGRPKGDGDGSQRFAAFLHPQLFHVLAYLFGPGQDDIHGGPGHDQQGCETDNANRISMHMLEKEG